MTDPQQYIRRQFEAQRQAFLPLPSGIETYTPTYQGSTVGGTTTYSVQEGFYVVLGPLVHVQGRVVWTGATGSGNARISLPLASSAVAGFAVPSFRPEAITFANVGVQGYVPAGTSYIEMVSGANNAGGAFVTVEAAGDVIFAVTYFID